MMNHCLLVLRQLHRDRDICPQKLWIVYHKLGLNKGNAKKMIQIEEDKIKVFKEKDKEAEDEDILFLKSLAPYFKYLNPVQKLRLKSKLQNTIADEISLAMPSPPSNSSATMSMSIIPPPVHALAMPSPASNSSMPIIPPQCTHPHH
ncbi:unnamed protein product [Acanthoscelides obtectus]|uniref:BESS domain-containing protein n=1 Tax=Acanthoscelides obtectus TaxID=200917 RepID=A0A9P0MN83_ACAOB|nr:unnamed protein product [Acanthoscelides obtectus]CAK1650408.1 hypothetical protein AOBTE_LOCUS16764 [Acanthoscelides obtectus]